MECQPLVSIIMPTYNSAKFIKCTIDSILCQSYDNLEIIIVDDGSTDNTEEIIKTYSTHKIKYIYQHNSGGPSKPRNTGISLARGELISLFDSDDIMNIHKIKYSVESFVNNNQIDILFTDFTVIDEVGDVLISRFLDNYTSFRKLLLPISNCNNTYLLIGDVYHELINANFIGTSGVMFKKSLFQEIGEMDVSISCSEDVDYWYRIAIVGKCFAYLDYIGHMYRKRPNSITSRLSENFPFMLKVLERQQKHILNEETKKVLNSLIGEVLLSYGWISLKLKNYELAQQNYGRYLSLGITYQGVKGYLISSAMRLFNRNSSETTKNGKY